MGDALVGQDNGNTKESSAGSDDCVAKTSICCACRHLADSSSPRSLAVFANALDASRAVGAHKRLLRERGVQLGDPALRLAAESTHAATLAMPLSRLMPARPR